MQKRATDNDQDVIKQTWLRDTLCSRLKREHTVPLYSFSVSAGLDKVDLESLELAGVEQARIETAAVVAKLLRTDDKRYWTGEPWTVVVLDESNIRVCYVRFSALA